MTINPSPRIFRSNLAPHGFLFILALLIAACSPGEETPARSRQGPADPAHEVSGEISNPINVILIVLDTLRPDHLSLEGYERITSPSLDAFAKKSLVFENAYSTSTWTIPAHASLFTGLAPNRSGVGLARHRLGADRETLAETLSRYGYETFAVVSNPNIGPTNGLDQGFEAFLEVWRDKDLEASNVDPRTGEQRKLIRDSPQWTHGDANAYEQTKAWMETRSPERPFFLFVNLFGMHDPYDSSGAHWGKFLKAGTPRPNTRQSTPPTHALYLGRFPLPSTEKLERLTALYDAEIVQADAILDQLLNLLEEQGHLENSLIIITSDHGENLGDHGHLQHCFGLYNSTTRVPLLIHAPALGVEPGRRREPAQLIDVMPTVLAALGAPAPKVESDGLDLLATSLPTDRALFMEHTGAGFVKGISKSARFPGEREHLSQFDRELIAVIEEGWKLIVNDLGERELYDLGVDPGEKVNLAGDDRQADRIARLLWQIEQYDAARADGEVKEEAEIAIDEEKLKALEAVGYLGRSSK